MASLERRDGLGSVNYFLPQGDHMLTGWQPATQARAVLLVLLVGTAAEAVHCRPAEAQVTAIAAGATVGFAIGKLGDEVSQLIDQARSAGNALQMEAGREVYLAIQNAQNAYARSMNATLDRADASVRGGIDQLHSMADDVQRQTFGSLDALSRRAQTFVNALPFRKHEPQVSTITPHFVAPARSTTPVVISFAGNFEFASRNGFAPTLLVGQSQVPLASNTTQDLGFSMPVAQLGVGADSRADQVHFVPGVLTVPWEESRWFGLRHERHNDVFRALIGVLPVSPGRIVLTHYTTRDVVERKRFHSTTFEVCSLVACGNNDRINVPFSIAPDPSWTIVRNTSSFDKSWNEGDNSFTFISDDGGQVRYDVTTIHHPIGQSGKVRFSISFDEERHSPVPDSTATVLNEGNTVGLHWGEQRTFPFAPGTYLVQFNAFDGSRAEFRAADSSNRFLIVRDQAGQLVLQAADPARLVWP